MSVATHLTLTGLHYYPVKSCGGLSVTEAELTRRGLPWDREWMVVDSNGTFVTQRVHPRMAQITPELSSDALILSVPTQEPLLLPLAWRERVERSVQVWKHSMSALDEGDEAANWMSSFLGEAVRLVRFPPMHRRLSSSEWTGSIEAENRFSDAYPMLVISEESLADLNRRIGGEPLPMNQFRPNLVVAGGVPYIEDIARTLKAPGVELRMVKPCTRCTITATNQSNGEVGSEPLKTLATYRRSERPSGVVFGQNLVLVAGLGERLRVGMQLVAQ